VKDSILSRAALQLRQRPAAPEFLCHRALHLQPRRRADRYDYGVVYRKGGSWKTAFGLNRIKRISLALKNEFDLFVKFRNQ